MIPSSSEQLADFQAIADDVEIGEGTRLSKFVNLYGCSIGHSSMIGPFVEIQAGATVGDRCKISSHTFICSGVTIGDRCFIGHGVMFTNDKTPRATSTAGQLQTDDDWVVEPTTIEDDVSIGSGATILPGVTVGHGAMVGAGATVAHDVAALTVVVGTPAKVVGSVQDQAKLGGDN